MGNCHGVVRRALVLILVVAALGASTAALAEDWKAKGIFGWMGVGKAYQIEKGHYSWVGEFTGTFFNDKGPGSLFHNAGVRCPGFNDLDLNAGKNHSGGYCVIQDAPGDQAFLNWQFEGDGKTAAGKFRYTGGTGKYAGISGENPAVGVIEVNWADGTATGYGTWNR